MSVQKVKLLIIDEVHLLNDERGAVIETIVARTLRQVSQEADSQDHIEFAATDASQRSSLRSLSSGLSASVQHYLTTSTLGIS